ncbi:MAG: YraN family protein [Ruminococcaceae bacterium]|nr:YraN family protein [Oscillospiraceae bacterium]
MSYKKAIGMRGEELACEFLAHAGFSIVARNLHVSHDEIDIIAEDEKYIVFAEVKTRAQTWQNRRFGRPGNAVDHDKQQKLLRTASEYLRRNSPGKQPRIDVIEVYFPAIREETPIDIASLIPTEIRHIKNAVHK